MTPPNDQQTALDHVLDVARRVADGRGSLKWLKDALDNLDTSADPLGDGATAPCVFGCGPGDESYVRPGYSIVPACPVHGWVCALLDERDAALTMLRDAWNAHMATCPQHAALPTIEPPSQADLDAWRDAPSGTASAVSRDVEPEDSGRCWINRGGFALDGITHMTGAQIRALPMPSIRDSDDLFVEVPGGEDLLVGRDEVVEVVNRRFFSVPSIINAG